MLEIKNLYKKYNKNNFYSLKNVNIKLESSEIVGLIGSNGAGKSTIIKSLVGFLKVEEGQILIGGFDISKDPIRAKSLIGYVPDNRATFEKMTGIEYINFMADIYNISQKDRIETLNMLNKYFDLKDRINSVISSYSHGMKQKICLMGAIIHRPKLLVLDEPLTGLDPLATENLKKFLLYYKSLGNTILFSSHNLDQVEKTCDRVYMIKKGEIIDNFSIKDFDKKHDQSLEEYFVQTFGDVNV